jgi:ribosomal protein S18 acetylase RimI-like enzyme
MTGVVLRELRAEDLADVGRLVVASFDPGLAPYMVATQHGWTDFLAVALDFPRQFPAQRLMVGELDGHVVAFADFRAPGDGTGFLSYICVDSTVRGRGVARGLFRECVRRSGPLTSVALDVFADNVPARTMYDAMGLVDGETQQWWRWPLPAPAATDAGPDLVVHGLAASLASLHRYGFCELSGDLDGRSVRCGRMGRKVLRLFGAVDADDPDLAVAIAGAFPDITEAFTVLPEGHRPDVPGAEAFNRVVRMTTDDVPRLLGAP